MAPGTTVVFLRQAISRRIEEPEPVTDAGQQADHGSGEAEGEV